MVFWNCSLSPIIKQIKKARAKKNELILITLPIISFCLTDTIPFNSEKNNKAIKPIAAPTPCIFEAVVIMSLL